jgi:hypothetical protein
MGFKLGLPPEESRNGPVELAVDGEVTGSLHLLNIADDGDAWFARSELAMESSRGGHQRSR